MSGIGSPSLEACPALVLNADYRPLSYFPLSVWHWRDAVRAIFLDRVHVISYYDRHISSPTKRLQLPSVIALKQYQSLDRHPPFTRFNVFLRDRFSCQYCGSQKTASSLTFDHVIPRSKGGRTTWQNIVAACSDCNLRKGDKLLRDSNMRIRSKPYIPSVFQLQENGRAFPPNYLHQSWRDFLYWDSELEP